MQSREARPTYKTTLTSSESITQMPEIIVDKASQKLFVGGKIIEFNKNTYKDNYWKVLLDLMANANTIIDRKMFRGFLAKAGFMAYGEGIKNCVYRLRGLIEVNPKDPKIITNVRVPGRKANYKFNARVRFQNDLKEKPLLTSQAQDRANQLDKKLIELEVKESQETVIIDGFNKLPEEIRNDLMSGPFLKFGDPEETLLKLLNITSERNVIAKRLLFNILYRRDISSENYSKDNFMLNELIESANEAIWIEGLVIKNKMIAIGNNKIKEQVFWLTKMDERHIASKPKVSRALRPSVTSKTTRKEVRTSINKHPEVAVNKSPEKIIINPQCILNNAQTAALVMILRAPNYVDILRRHGINVSPFQINWINNTISKNHASLKNLFMDEVMKNALPQLAQHLKAFANGKRGEYVASNDELVGALFKLIPVNIKEDGIVSMLAEIENVVNRG